MIKMKKLVLFLISTLFIISISNGAIFEEEYTGGLTNTPQGSQFLVQTLKYEPYPVNPGDFFDVWIKVENIGNQDALNSKFELVPKYPFSSNDNLIREYGRISKNRGLEGEINQVVLKYRVKVADNAPEGINDLEFKAFPSGTTKKLRIEIGKTKTDFDVVMQDSTAQGTSLAIANIGENPATAVIIRIKEQEDFTVRGSQASIIGNLDKGDFTTVTFKLTEEKNANELLIQIDYTDIAGVRNSVEKKVIVDIISTSLFQEGGQGRYNLGSSGGLLSKLFYVVIGITLGIVIVIAKRKLKKRKR